MEEYNFCPPISERIKSLSFDDFTDVQKQLFPKLLNKENVLIEADYGEGKTASFVLPSLNRIETEQLEGVSTLILTPTRGLIFKVKKTVELYADAINLPFFAFTRDRFKETLAEDTAGAKLIIATPDQISALQEHIDFSALKQLVVDDFDMMRFFGQDQAVLDLVETLSSSVQKTVFTSRYDDRLQEKVSALGEFEHLKIKAHDIPLADIRQKQQECRDFNEQSRALENILREENNRRVVVFVDEPWQMRKVSAMIRSKVRMTCRYLDLERDEVSPRDIKIFLEGGYHVLIIYGFDGQDVHIHEATQIINIGAVDFEDELEDRANLLARRSKLYRDNPIVTLTLNERKEKKAYSYEVNDEDDEEIPVVVTGSAEDVKPELVFGRVSKERRRR